MLAQTLPSLHPSIPAGPFDLITLLAHEPPLRWRPEPGERITGRLVKIADKTSFGTVAPTLYLLLPDGRYATVRASGVVLRGAVTTLDMQPGEDVALKYEGMQVSNAGRPYAMHRAAVRRGGRWVVAS